MKKILLILLTIFLIIVVPKLNADSTYKYKEDNYVIEFDNFNSKDINKLFEDINGGVIEVEVQIKNIIKTYRINTLITDNLEYEITKKIVKSLETDNLRELSSIASIKGFKINKMTLRCTLNIYEIIKERSLNV